MLLLYTTFLFGHEFYPKAIFLDTTNEHWVEFARRYMYAIIFQITLFLLFFFLVSANESHSVYQYMPGFRPTSRTIKFK